MGKPPSTITDHFSFPLPRAGAVYSVLANPFLRVPCITPGPQTQCPPPAQQQAIHAPCIAAFCANSLLSPVLGTDTHARLFTPASGRTSLNPWPTHLPNTLSPAGKKSSSSSRTSARSACTARFSSGTIRAWAWTKRSVSDSRPDVSGWRCLLSGRNEKTLYYRGYGNSTSV